jgi:poly-beta-1,6-N-acetyl-D-glucosamine synthase
MPDFIQNYWNVLAQEIAGLGLAFSGNFGEIFLSVIVYAYVMSILWTLTSLVYWVRSRRRMPVADHRSVPGYTVLIPFYGEPLAALRSAQSLAGVTPPPEKIILIDDGSIHGMPAGTVLPKGATLLSLQQRRGKAGALNAALRGVTSEIIVCIDADTEVRSLDWRHMLASFDDPHLGAVTGKIWPVAERSIIGRFQQLDYLAVITVIKAAESIWGGLLTVSGAFVAYRREALKAAGGWREDKAAEDIDISWRMQCDGWRLAFDTSWTCAVEMAPTIPALWRQRRRWSSGLGQALRDHGPRALLQGARHLPVVVISIANIFWIASMLVLAATATYELVSAIANGGGCPISPNIVWAAQIGLLLFSLQFVSAMLIDGRPWRTYIGLIAFVPFYAAYFWSILLSSFLFGFPKGLARKGLGIWQPTVRQSVQTNKGLNT